MMQCIYIAFINCPGNWWTEVAGKSCSVEPSGPMNKMVERFEIRSLLESSDSYGQVFPVILSRCHLWHSAISFKSTQMAYIHSEPSCYLCSKIVCTTAYILGAFEVTVQLGWFTCCHDSVLQTFLALETVAKPYKFCEISNED